VLEDRHPLDAVFSSQIVEQQLEADICEGSPVAVHEERDRRGRIGEPVGEVAEGEASGVGLARQPDRGNRGRLCPQPEKCRLGLPLTRERERAERCAAGIERLEGDVEQIKEVRLGDHANGLLGRSKVHLVAAIDGVAANAIQRQ